jgi:hypothetical protein
MSRSEQVIAAVSAAIIGAVIAGIFFYSRSRFHQSFLKLFLWRIT